MNKQVLERLCELQKINQQAVLITIIQTWGSTPRKVGSKMLIEADGTMVGTIGGGCAEAEVRLQALQALTEHRSCIHKIDMLNSVAADEGMVCGGVMNVFIQVV